MKPSEAANYCVKEDTRKEGPWEFGVKPMFNDERKDIWASAKAAAIANKLDEIPPQLLVPNIRNFCFIRDMYCKLPPPKADIRGIWIHGVSGTGKTSKVQVDFNGLIYKKSRNKWWCGYNNEVICVMEDADPDSMRKLGGYVKDWCDRFGFKAEIKNGNAYPDYDYFIITSQYTPEECFERPQDADAVRRRCRVIEFKQAIL